MYDFVMKAQTRCCNVYLDVCRKCVFPLDLLVVAKVFQQVVCFSDFFNDVYVLLRMLHKHDCFCCNHSCLVC
jgi:hypothetical protein